MSNLPPGCGRVPGEDTPDQHPLSIKLQDLLEEYELPYKAVESVIELFDKALDEESPILVRMDQLPWDEYGSEFQEFGGGWLFSTNATRGEWHGEGPTRIAAMLSWMNNARQPTKLAEATATRLHEVARRKLTNAQLEKVLDIVVSHAAVYALDDAYTERDALRAKVEKMEEDAAREMWARMALEQELKELREAHPPQANSQPDCGGLRVGDSEPESAAHCIWPDCGFDTNCVQSGSACGPNCPPNSRCSSPPARAVTDEMVREAIATARDAILNGRGALESVLDGDQTNAVLSVFDDAFNALSASSAGDEGNGGEG